MLLVLLVVLLAAWLLHLTPLTVRDRGPPLVLVRVSRMWSDHPVAFVVREGGVETLRR